MMETDGSKLAFDQAIWELRRYQPIRKTIDANEMRISQQRRKLSESWEICPEDREMGRIVS